MKTSFLPVDGAVKVRNRHRRRGRRRSEWQTSKVGGAAAAVAAFGEGAKKGRWVSSGRNEGRRIAKNRSSCATSLRRMGSAVQTGYAVIIYETRSQIGNMDSTLIGSLRSRLLCI